MAYRPNIKNADGTLKDLPLEAETAVKLKTPRSISLSGVVATAQNFDGTSAITIPVTSIPATLLTGTGNIDITGKAARATMDENSNNIASYYLPKSNGTTNGYLAVNNTNSKITQSSVSPVGNNIGANGLMLTHLSNDEGGLLINEDGAYLWNSTDSGSLLRGLDEDVWGNYAGAKKDCTFANGLMFDFDSSGNLKIKGKFYQDNGASPVVVTTISASNITCTSNSALGGYTNLQSILNYLANVLTGNQTVTKIKANTFDTTT